MTGLKRHSPNTTKYQGLKSKQSAGYHIIYMHFLCNDQNPIRCKYM